MLNTIRQLSFPFLIALSSISLPACAERQEQAAENHQAGAQFMAENGKKEGIQTTGSGLQYQVLKPGTGRSPVATDKVTVSYSGSLISGKKFDASDNITFSLNAVIPGWTEGLQLMKEGAQYRFFIPSKLAYGERGAGRVIGPNETLIFDVELFKVN